MFFSCIGSAVLQSYSGEDVYTWEKEFEMQGCRWKRQDSAALPPKPKPSRSPNSGVPAGLSQSEGAPSWVLDPDSTATDDYCLLYQNPDLSGGRALLDRDACPDHCGCSPTPFSGTRHRAPPPPHTSKLSLLGLLSAGLKNSVISAWAEQAARCWPSCAQTLLDSPFNVNPRPPKPSAYLSLIPRHP